MEQIREAAIRIFEAGLQGLDGDPRPMDDCMTTLAVENAIAGVSHEDFLQSELPAEATKMVITAAMEFAEAVGGWGVLERVAAVTADLVKEPTFDPWREMAGIVNAWSDAADEPWGASWQRIREALEREQ